MKEPTIVSTAQFIQPVPEKMRLEMVVGMEIEILACQRSVLFSNEPFEKRTEIPIEEVDSNFDDKFESHFFGNGPYMYRLIHTHPTMCSRIAAFSYTCCSDPNHSSPTRTIRYVEMYIHGLYVSCDMYDVYNMYNM